MSSKPKWLIAGGLGMIGRNLVKYLIDNTLASEIRIADKRLPFMSFLSVDHKAAIENELVECIQADISDDEHLDRVFADPRGGGSFDFVVNLAAETSLGKADEFYQKTVDGALKLAQNAARAGVRKFIQVSTAQVYASNARPVNESGKLGPWTTVAETSFRAEEAVRSVPGLAVIILRPAVVYGPGDVGGLMPRAVCAAAYIKIRDTMDFMWDADLKCNTVHVFDVVRAIYHVARKAEAGTVWNVCDKTDTDQGKLAAALRSIFGIEISFAGTVMSNLAKMKMDSVTDSANETHLGPWLALLREYNIRNTPLSPFLHKQLLQNHNMCIDGSALETTLGFKYAVPTFTADGLKDVIAQHINQRIFPPIVPGIPAPAPVATTGGGGASASSSATSGRSAGGAGAGSA